VLFEKSGQTDPGVLLSMCTPQELVYNHTWDQEMLVKRYVDLLVSIRHPLPCKCSTNRLLWRQSRCDESTRRLGKKIETFTYVFDLAGVNLSHRKGLALLGLLSESDKVPETQYELHSPVCTWGVAVHQQACGRILLSVRARWLCCSHDSCITLSG